MYAVHHVLYVPRALPVYYQICDRPHNCCAHFFNVDFVRCVKRHLILPPWAVVFAFVCLLYNAEKCHVARCGNFCFARRLCQFTYFDAMVGANLFCNLRRRSAKLSPYIVISNVKSSVVGFQAVSVFVTVSIIHLPLEQQLVILPKLYCVAAFGLKTFDKRRFQRSRRAVHIAGPR